MPRRVYKPNPKHKRGACGEGPPRWFPSSDSLCPDDMDTETAQALLDGAIGGNDPAHPTGRALYAMHDGTFYKAYPESVVTRSDDELVEPWHGYPVRRELVPRQIPARVLRQFLHDGRLTRPEYRKLVGSAR
jgi:hypothetical protein